MADEQETPAPAPPAPTPDPTPITEQPDQRPYEFPDLDWNRRDLGDVPERKSETRED